METPPVTETNPLGDTMQRQLSQTLAITMIAIGLLWARPMTSVSAEAEQPAAVAEQPAADAAQPAVETPAIEKLVIETAVESPPPLVIRGPDARRQLIVSGHHADGTLSDLTRTVRFHVEPADIVQIDPTGLVTPLAEGHVTIRAEASEGASATIDLTVESFSDQQPVNFANQIVPIFTKLGCNSGGCHGKSGGQNGFRLSLLGFEPPEDFEHLVHEGRGRRVFPGAPEQSLLLTKPTGQLPHGGGERFDTASPYYRLIRRWIAQGLPYGQPDDPVVTRIELLPADRVMRPGSVQQIAAVAHMSDGSRDDVTRTTQFEPNEPDLAEVSVTGLVETKDQPGDVAVMARYQGHVAVFRATVPLGAEVTDLPVAKNFVDEWVVKKLQQLGLPPSEISDDSTFLRRTSLDLTGRLPTLDETNAFLQNPDPQKRDTWIDRMVDSAEYADLFANKWMTVLRNKRRSEDHRRGTYAFHWWIRQNLLQGKPYDQFVRDIIGAAGEVGDNPPVVWYREVSTTETQVEDVAQLFMGLRIQCARCHHHPFEKWSQQDYYGLAAFFSQVGRKEGMQPGESKIFHKRGSASAVHPKTKQSVKPTGLGADPLDIAADRDPRQALVDWMTSTENPFFARALVNRYWKHFFGRGLVEPEDDMRLTNPATNPELLDALAAHFVQSNYDVKDLVRTICRSNAYQFSSLPNDHNAKDKQNFSRYYPRRLPAEVLLDAINHLTASTTNFSGVPPGTRAVALPDTEFSSYFLTVFGRPESASACECERTSEASLTQSLHLINSNEIQTKLSADSGRAAKLAAEENRGHAEKIAELYLLAYSRVPTAEESAAALAHLEKTESPREGYEDILWALINTKEFLFNH